LPSKHLCVVRCISHAFGILHGVNDFKLYRLACADKRLRASGLWRYLRNLALPGIGWEPDLDEENLILDSIFNIISPHKAKMLQLDSMRFETANSFARFAEQFPEFLRRLKRIDMDISYGKDWECPPFSTGIVFEALESLELFGPKQILISFLQNSFPVLKSFTSSLGEDFIAIVLTALRESVAHLEELEINVRLDNKSSFDLIVDTAKHYRDTLKTFRIGRFSHEMSSFIFGEPDDFEIFVAGQIAQRLHSKICVAPPNFKVYGLDLWSYYWVYSFPSEVARVVFTPEVLDEFFWACHSDQTHAPGKIIDEMRRFAQNNAVSPTIRVPWVWKTMRALRLFESDVWTTTEIPLMHLLVVLWDSTSNYLDFDAVRTLEGEISTLVKSKLVANPSLLEQCLIQFSSYKIKAPWVVQRLIEDANWVRDSKFDFNTSDFFPGVPLWRASLTSPQLLKCIFQHPTFDCARLMSHPAGPKSPAVDILMELMQNDKMEDCVHIFFHKHQQTAEGRKILLRDLEEAPKFILITLSRNMKLISSILNLFDGDVAKFAKSKIALMAASDDFDSIIPLFNQFGSSESNSADVARAHLWNLALRLDDPKNLVKRVIALKSSGSPIPIDLAELVRGERPQFLDFSADDFAKVDSSASRILKALSKQ
jgi:hypothetical protein